MKKANELRAHLAQWVPDLARHPDKLHILIDKGAIAARFGGPSFEYRYTARILVTDFAESPDTLVVPLLAWIEANQADLLLNPDKQGQALTFEAEAVDHDKIDIALSIELSERVVVSAVSAGYQCKHLADPPLPDLSGPSNWSIYLKGELLAASAE